MRSILSIIPIFALAAALPVAAPAQPAGGTALQPITFIPIQLGSCASFWGDTGIITSDSMLHALVDARQFIGQCAGYTPPAIDFSRDVLIGGTAFGDCHARYRIRLLRDDAHCCYHFIVRERYGGCRGGRMWQHWLIAPKLPEGYTVNFVHIDDDDDDDSDGPFEAFGE